MGGLPVIHSSSGCTGCEMYARCSGWLRSSMIAEKTFLRSPGSSTGVATAASGLLLGPAVAAAS